MNGFYGTFYKKTMNKVLIITAVVYVAVALSVYFYTLKKKKDDE